MFLKNIQYFKLRVSPPSSSSTKKGPSTLVSDMTSATVCPSNKAPPFLLFYSILAYQACITALLMAATEDQSEMESGEERTSPGNENGAGGCRTRTTKNTSPEKGPQKELDSFSQTTQLLSFLFCAFATFSFSALGRGEEQRDRDEMRILK